MSARWMRGEVPPGDQYELEQSLEGSPRVDTLGEGQGDEPDYWAATLYLPDPESRSGWQLHGVKKRNEKSPERRLGF